MKGKDRSMRSIRIIYVTTTLLLFAVSFYVFTEIKELNKAAEMVNHTMEVSLELEKLIGSVKDAQGGHRGYLITHDSAYLTTFTKALAQYPVYQRNVQELTRDNPTQQKHIVELSQLTKNREKYFYKILEIDKARKTTRQELIVGELIMDSLRTKVDLMTGIENKFLKRRSTTFEKQALSTPILILTTSLIALFILLLSYWRLTNALKNAQRLSKSLQGLVMEAPLRIALLRGPQHVVELANDFYLKAAHKKDIQNKPIREVYPEYKDAGYFELLDEVYKTGKTYTGHEAHLRDDVGNGPEDFYFNFEYRALRNNDGQIDGVVVQGIDVTAQVIGRKKVEESEERFIAFANSISQLAWMTDAEGWIYWYNQRWYDYTGTTFEQMQGWGWQSVHHPDLVEGVTARFKKAIEAGTDWEDTFLLRGKDGTFRWFLSRALPIRDNKGNIIRWIGSNTDITTQKIAEENVKESEGRFRLLAEALPQLVWVTTPEGINEYTSDRWEEYTGIKPGGLEEWTAIVHPEDLDNINNAWMHSLSSGTIYKHDVRLKSKTGEYKWFTVNGEPIFDEENKIVKWVGAFTDTHAEKSFAQQLEKQVAERTRDLDQKNKDLERMNKELQSFAYVSSHDLQEPLRKIQTFSTRIQEKEIHNLSESGIDYFRRMQAAASRMQHLIQDLLAFSQAGTDDRTIETMDLNKIVNEVKQEFKETIEEKNALIETNELCTLNVIPFQFRQLMQNLIGNALKFSKPGTAPHIVIKCNNSNLNRLNNLNHAVQQNGLDAKEIWHISVSDNGIGFEPHYSERIFEVFQRLHRKDAYPGTGIGLAIVKKIVENHNGVIKVSSEPGKGTTFDIFIPKS